MNESNVITNDSLFQLQTIDVQNIKQTKAGRIRYDSKNQSNLYFLNLSDPYDQRLLLKLMESENFAKNCKECRLNGEVIKPSKVE